MHTREQATCGFYLISTRLDILAGLLLFAMNSMTSGRAEPEAQILGNILNLDDIDPNSKLYYQVCRPLTFL